jgi:hypothetical protein
VTASINAADLGPVGNLDVTVVNPAQGGLGGGTSTGFKFAIDTATGTNGAVTSSTTTTSLTVTKGQNVTMNVTLAGTNSTTQITANCLNLPPGVTCSYSNGVVTFSTTASTLPGTYQVTVVFSASQQVTAMAMHPRFYYAAWTGVWGLPMGLMLIGAGRRKSLRRWLVLMAGITLLMMLSACGGGSKPQPTPTPTTVTSQSSLAVVLTVN